METIKGVYLYTHRLVKADEELHKWIKKAVLIPENQQAMQFLPLGLTSGGIFLGLDFNLAHINAFKRIVTNNLIIDNISRNHAYLSRVLLRVMVEGVHVANLLEDVSENGRFEVFKEGCVFGPCADYLRQYFYNKVERAVLMVYEKSQKAGAPDRRRISDTPFFPVRLPIINVDHLELSGQLASLYQAIPDSEMELYTLEIS